MWPCRGWERGRVIALELGWGWGRGGGVQSRHGAAAMWPPRRQAKLKLAISIVPISRFLTQASGASW